MGSNPFRAFGDRAVLEGAVFNLVFACLVFFLQPLATETVAGSIMRSERNAGLGMLILAASAAEGVALFVKIRIVISNFSGSARVPIVLGVFHMATTAFLAITVFSLFGVSMRKGGGDELPVTGVMFALVVKELIVFGGFIARPSAFWVRPFRLELPVDMVLMLYAWLVWTALWMPIELQEAGKKYTPGLTVVYAISASFLFLFFYAPLRIPYFMEEFAARKGNTLQIASSMTLPLAAALHRMLFS